MLRNLLALGLFFALAGCSTFSDYTEEFRSLYGTARFAAAEEEIDRLIAKEVGIDPSEVGTAEAVDVDGGNTCIFFLEKGMVRLARGDARTAIALFRRARDELDSRWVEDAGVYFRQFAAALTDDRALEYAGADYEHVVVRVLLALADLLVGGEDAYAYAAQVGEKQEEIIGSPFGALDDGEGYKPREKYRRVAAGAYIQGLIRESSLDADEACRAYQRAQEYDPGNRLFDAGSQRACEGNYVRAGNGVLNVFYLGGRGPHLVSAKSRPTDLALRLAGAMLLILGRDPSVLFQASIPVPGLQINDAALASLDVDAADQRASTVTILNVNRIAQEQLDANMPWILTRALVRRALKAGAGAALKQGIRHATRSRGWGLVAGGLFNFLTTATEVADTRNWSTLPAELQASRIELPAGEHDVQVFGVGIRRVRIAEGRDSTLLVLRPAPGLPGVMLVDEFSDASPFPTPTPAP